MVLRFTPKRLLDATYRKVKYRNQPRTEGYWIKRNKMVEFLQRQGARIVDITQDRRDILVDCRYCVARG
jgi:hypothetical protein